MADTQTTNLNLTKPEPGAAEDTWGISLNADLDALDAIFSSTGTQINLNPNQVNFADGKKLIFGTGSDLEIYHDGNNSHVRDQGTGNILISASDKLIIRDTTDGAQVAVFDTDGAVSLNYGNSTKFATTSSGIDVTGRATADGLTSIGSLGTWAIQDSGNIQTFSRAGANYIRASDASGILRFDTGGTTIRQKIADNGDISFYDDTGSTQGFFWDASAERLGLGTTSPGNTLEVNAPSTNGIKISSTAPYLFFNDTDTSHGYDSSISQSGTILYVGGATPAQGIVFRNKASFGESARFDTSGNLLVGTTSTTPSTGGNSITGGSTGYIVTSHADGTSGGNWYHAFRYNTNTIGSIAQSGTTAVLYNTSSDARLKDVTGEARGLDVINELNPVAYNWKADGKADEGLIAQEVKELVPNAVSGSEEEMYQMDYSKLVVHLVAGMKEQQTQIESLKGEIANLKGE